MNRGILHWTAFLLSLVAVLAAASAMQAFSQLWSEQYDLTLDRTLSLSEYGKSVLRTVKAPLRIEYYYRRGDRMRARDLLDLVAAESPEIRYELIDIDRNPLRAKQSDVRRFDRAVLLYEGREAVTPAATEEALLGGIAQIVEHRRLVLYLLTDHGERTTRVGHDDQLGRAAQILRREGYEIRPLSLLRGDRVPDDASAVIVAGPELDFVEKELGLLDRYLLGGGSVLVLLDPVKLPHLEEWIASHGLRVVDDVVIDLANRVYGGDGTNVLVPYFRDHPAAKALGTPAVLGRARSVATLDGGEGASDAPVQVVARTTPESFVASDAERTRRGKVAFDETSDRSGPAGVMGVSAVAAPAGGREGRLVVLGDADFATDDFITLLGNQDLLLNVIGWLTEREASGARSRAEAAGLLPVSPIYVSDRLIRWIFWSCVVLQPGIVVLAGVLVVWRQRRRR